MTGFKLTKSVDRNDCPHFNLTKTVAHNNRLLFIMTIFTLHPGI